MIKLFKKKEMIHDGGVHEQGNYVNAVIFSGCVFMIIFLIWLGFMAYLSA